MNNWTIAGRLGKDAETRYTQSGKSVTGFSVAVDQRRGGEKTVMWVDCSMWGERGEKLAQYLTKGTSVALSGEAGVRVHEGKAYQTLNVRELTLMGGGSGSAQTGGGSGTPSGQRQSRMQPPADEGFDDEFGDRIPFASRHGVF